ncbi:hypothetical protein ACIBLA_29655 [Streptomyces sp. NPDC050433]|uniref:hypothetical protein n=1 Tax=unclassified Streptomyces TaxID=2593676 RepID=UPI00343325FA
MGRKGGAVNASGFGRAGSAVGRLLLIVVLTLGVFAMHTVGHPDEAYGSGAGATAHAAPELPHTPPTDEPVMGMDGTGMDMASLCVAVLSTWASAGLLLAAFARRLPWFTGPLAGAALAPRPNPPPRTPELTFLSVLRI